METTPSAPIRSARQIDLPLMDRLHTMTFAPKLMGRSLNAASRRILTSYRIKLRQAERFVIDDDAVKLVCRLSHEQERLAGWSFLARLPYQVIWLEFNLHTKVREFEIMETLRRRFNPEEVSPVIGYLLYKDGHSNSRWIAHEFKELMGEIVPGMIAFLFDPENQGIAAVMGSETWNSPTLSRRPNFPRIPATVRAADLDDRPAGGRADWTDTTKDGDILTEVDPEFVLCGVFGQGGGTTLAAPEWFSSRGAAIVDPFWEHYLSERPVDSVNNLMAMEVMEQAGVLRWLVTLFATINGLPRAVKPINSRPGRRTMGMNTVPYLQHSNLSITIPRDDRVVWARQHLDREAHGARRAWHRVIGHWRIIERGRAPRQMCRHEPVMVENGVGMCNRCQLMIRWIEVPNGRGDPALGMIEHTYTIHGKRRIYRKPPDLTSPSQ